MTKYAALLRGVNVGGNNKISMPELKIAFEKQGFLNVSTYINSGNIIFESEYDESALKNVCERLIESKFALKIAVGIMAASELIDAISHAPEWWDNDPQSRHNAIFVIPPVTAAEIFSEVGETKPEYEKAEYRGKVIFWSASLATFSRTRWSKIIENKATYRAITIRNANTAKKLCELCKGKITL